MEEKRDQLPFSPRRHEGHEVGAKSSLLRGNIARFCQHACVLKCPPPQLRFITCDSAHLHCILHFLRAFVVNIASRGSTNHNRTHCSAPRIRTSSYPKTSAHARGSRGRGDTVSLSNGTPSHYLLSSVWSSNRVKFAITSCCLKKTLLSAGQEWGRSQLADKGFCVRWAKARNLLCRELRREPLGPELMAEGLRRQSSRRSSRQSTQ